jgi:hypothetical protein
MNEFLSTSTDSKEHSVEVKRENKSFSVPQQKHPTTSSVDDSIDNTPIYIGEKQEKTILLTNHLKKEEKMEEQSITNSQKANAYENEIKQKQEIKQVGEINLAQKVEKNSPLSILDSVVLSVTQTPKATGGDSNMPLEQLCREKFGYTGGEMSSFNYAFVRRRRRRQFRFDIFPFVPAANRSNIKTINIVAEGGTGKTWTMCDWTLHFIHNVTLFNDKDNRLPVFNKEHNGVGILSLEEGDMIQDNLDRIEQGMIDNGIITEEDAKQRGNRLSVICGSDRWFFELDKQNQFKHLEECCKAYNWKWIFIDSGSVYSARFGAGNNNDNIRMFEVYEPVFALAEKYELNVIILNHTRKKYDFAQWSTMTQDDLIGASFQADISCSMIGIWADSKDENILNYKLLKCNGLKPEVRDRIYRVRRTEGELMPETEEYTDDELVDIPEEIKKDLKNNRTLSFNLEDIKSAKEMREEKAQSRAEKQDAYEYTMQVLFNMYSKMGQGSQSYIATWANSHKNEKGEYDMKTKTGKDWTAENLLGALRKYRTDNNLSLPTHLYKDYLAKQVDTAMKADDQRKEELKNAPSDEGWFDKYDSLKLQDGDKIRLSSYSNKLTDYSLSEPINVKVIKNSDNHIRFLLEDENILEGLSKGENDENIDYYYENYTLD